MPDPEKDQPCTKDTLKRLKRVIRAYNQEHANNLFMVRLVCMNALIYSFIHLKVNLILNHPFIYLFAHQFTQTHTHKHKQCFHSQDRMEYLPFGLTRTEVKEKAEKEKAMAPSLKRGAQAERVEVPPPKIRPKWCVEKVRVGCACVCACKEALLASIGV